MIEERLADEISRAVMDCQHVARLSDTVATYLPGRVIPGIAMHDQPHQCLEVRVIAWWGPTMTEVADQVRAAVRRVLPAVPLNVTIEDLDLTRGTPPNGEFVPTTPTDRS